VKKKKGLHHSRKPDEPGYDFADWALNKVIVETIKEMFVQPRVDLCATELNKKGEFYFKRDDLIGGELEKNCLGKNAYRFNWNMFNGLLCWVNPPFDEIMNVVDKAI
jgi:hypothetical protein